MSTPSQFKGCNPSELAIGLDSLPPFAAFGTVGLKQEDVAVAFVSSLAAPAATSSSAMRAATKVAAAASSSCSALLAALASLVVPTAATVASATDAHGSSIKEPPVRQRTELSDALSVASATDAHGSLIEEPQVRKRSKLSEALSAYREVHSKEVNEAWLTMAVCCSGREQHISSNQDEPATGKLLPASGQEGAREEPVHKRFKNQARGPDTYVVFALWQSLDSSCPATWDRGLQGSLGSTKVRGRTRSM